MNTKNIPVAKESKVFLCFCHSLWHDGTKAGDSRALDSRVCESNTEQGIREAGEGKAEGYSNTLNFTAELRCLAAGNAALQTCEAPPGASTMQVC